VHRTRIDWIAYNRRAEIYLGHGKVLNIDLPPGDHPPAAGRTGMSARLVEAWRTA
jgi:hypothetical protein